MDALSLFLESTFFWVMAFFAACLVVVLLMPKQVPNLTAVRNDFQNWVREHYVHLSIAIASGLIVLAIVLYVHDLPGLIVRTVVGLQAVLSDQTDAPDTDKTVRIRNLAYAFGALAAALTIMATIPFQLIKVWLNDRSARTAEQSHITDQIKKAVEGLGVEKTVRKVIDTPRYRKKTANGCLMNKGTPSRPCVQTANPSSTAKPSITPNPTSKCASGPSMRWNGSVRTACATTWRSWKS